MKNTSLEQVMDKIEGQSEFYFIFNQKQIDVNRTVDIQVENKLITDILPELFKGTNVNYVVFDRKILLTTDPLENRLLAIASGPELQQKQITGTVTDKDGTPLPGATVVVTGTNRGTLTDITGKYSIEVPQGSKSLTFSFTGMESQEISIGTLTQINVTLSASTIGLDEVVVVGYGTQSKRNVSGSLTNVTQKDFNKGVTQTVADLLQGKVAGLTITTEGGDVTATQSIRLRGISSLTGSSSPFVVIDGVPGMDMNSVAPEDIESISVLKDASATAIYGSRSASGVVLITTKKGKQGQPSIQYSNYVAVDFIARKPDVLTASEWRQYASSNGIDVSGLDLGANTDWFKEITRTGISHNHNLSLSGGIKNGNYRASLNYLNREGIMKDNQMERYNGLFSINQRALNDKLNISLLGGTVYSDFQPTNNYNSTLAYNMLPVYPVKNADGSWFDIQEWDQGNPVNNIANNKNLHKTSLLYANAKVDLEVFKGFTAGINLFKQRKAEDISMYNASTTQAGRQDNGYAKRENDLWDKNLLETTLNYSRIIGENDFKILAGYSYEDNFYQTVSASNRGFISDIFEYNNLSIGENLFPTDVNSYKNSNRLISFFGRVNYNYSGKYFLTATLRRDGSSKFGANHKWGYFPSVSGAWRISDEAFMKNVSVISDLKFRVGYGVVGNQDGIGPYNSLALYGRGDEYFDNGKWHNTFKYAQNENPNLEWEQTASFNPGIDFGLFKNRINGTIDYYVKKTSGLLYVYNVPVPPYLYPTMLANVGDMNNKGIEVVITGEPITTKDLNWTVTVNFAHNKNVITRLSNDIYSTARIFTGYVNLRGSGYLTSSIVEEGQEVGTFYNLKGNGIDQDGKFIIEDINPDGVINNSDYTYIGHALPRLTYGIQSTLSYKKFDLTVFLRGLYGNNVLNSPRIQYSNSKWLPGANVLAEALTNGIKQDPLFSSYYIEKGSFLRLDNASLAYNFDLRNALGINKFRIYVSGQNLFIITKFKGLDPEVNMSGLAPGVMETFYVPKARTLSIGLDVSF
jgi:iron complex outermembrane receptor protein